MARKRYATERIISLLREAEVRLGRSETIGGICRAFGISEQSYYRWRREYGGLKLNQAKRFKDRERENRACSMIMGSSSRGNRNGARRFLSGFLYLIKPPPPCSAFAPQRLCSMPKSIFLSLAGLQTVCLRSAAALVVLFAALPANAQDGNWSGFYAGLNAGGVWGNSDTNVGCADNTGFGVCALAAAENPFPFNFSNDLNGFIGGAQAGYNFQSGKMVFGIEADIAWGSLDANTSVSNGDTANFVPSVVRVSQDLEYLATLRGRLGYAVHSHMLVYATGGLAFGDVSDSYALSFPSLDDYARASDR